MSVISQGRALLAGVLLASCGCASTVTSSPNLQNVQAIPSVAAQSGLKRGLYVLSSSGIAGFPTNNRKNNGPFCSLDNSTDGVGSIAFDRKGNLIVSNFTSSTITVYGAPSTHEACGKIIGVMQDPFGQPVDAASVNAATGRIVVIAEQQVDICSLRHGCTKRLGAGLLTAAASIALSRNGDCWAEADAPSGPGVLYYFKGCNSDGQLTTGYYGGSDNYGGLDIDNYGNIVSIFANYHNTPAVYVYSGCNPVCAPVSGPLPLVGNGTYGHLNKDSTELAVADTQLSSIDVYKFSPTSLRFEYSFTGGLSGIAGVAYNPRAQ
ncbi:MAG: hypothetical protein ABI431_02570 [Candidatus Tumulicola sp.]